MALVVFLNRIENFTNIFRKELKVNTKYTFFKSDYYIIGLNRQNKHLVVDRKWHF